MNFDMEALSKLLTVKEVASMFEVRQGIVRKAARDGTIPGAISVLGKTGFDPEAVLEWTPPEPGTRRVGASREDGKRRFRIYLSDTEPNNELAKLLAEGYEITDPRVASRERRAARKAAKANEAGLSPEDVSAGVAEALEVAASEDPFAEFGVD